MDRVILFAMHRDEYTPSPSGAEPGALELEEVDGRWKLSA